MNRQLLLLLMLLTLAVLVWYHPVGGVLGVLFGFFVAAPVVRLWDGGR